MVLHSILKYTIITVTPYYIIVTLATFIKVGGKRNMKGNQKAKLVEDDHADARMVGMIVGILVVIVIGLLVFTEISNSIETGTTEGAVAHASVNTTAGTVFTLAPIVAIVLVASIILAVVTGFGGGKQGM